MSAFLVIETITNEVMGWEYTPRGGWDIITTNSDYCITKILMKAFLSKEEAEFFRASCKEEVIEILHEDERSPDRPVERRTTKKYLILELHYGAKLWNKSYGCYGDPGAQCSMIKVEKKVYVGEIILPSIEATIRSRFLRESSSQSCAKSAPAPRGSGVGDDT